MARIHQRFPDHQERMYHCRDLSAGLFAGSAIATIGEGFMDLPTDNRILVGIVSLLFAFGSAAYGVGAHLAEDAMLQQETNPELP